jgi:O-antigen ligase
VSEVVIETDSTTERWRRRLRIGLGLLILLSPLPLGGRLAWAVLGLELCALALGSLAIWIVSRSEFSVTLAGRAALVAAATVLLIGVLQLVPLPLDVGEFLSGPSATAHRDVGAVIPELAVSTTPVSLSPPDTVDAVLRWIAFVLVAFSAAVAVRTVEQLKQLAGFIVASGAFQAIYGAAEYLSGHQHIFWYPKVYYSDEASGTFINRNHFAAYLAMTLPIALASVLASPWKRRTMRWREVVLEFARRNGLMLAAGVGAAAMIWVGVIFSYSRGGLAVALAGVGFLVLATRGRWRRARALGLLLLLPTLALLWMEIRAPGERFLEQGIQAGSLGNRTVVWSATARMAHDALPLGTGLGTFAEAFPLYRPPTIRLYWDHAHNDWLESLAEGGPVTLLAVLVIAGVAVVAPLFRSSEFFGPDSVWRAGLGAAVFVAALHSTVDFPLRIPAVGLLAAVLIGLSCDGLQASEIRSDPTVTPLRRTPRGPASRSRAE